MKLASIVVAMGVVLGALVIAPNLLYSLSWDLSLLTLAAWIILAPFLMSRQRGAKTNAGRIASIGLASATVLVGTVAAVAGLYLSASAVPLAQAPVLLEADAPPTSVLTYILGAEVSADLTGEKPSLVLTRVTPGTRAEALRLEEGDRIIAANGIPVADPENDPLVLEAMRTRMSADSVARSADSVRIALERDRQLLDLARQRLAIIRGPTNGEASTVGDVSLDSATKTQSDSVIALELRVNDLEARSAAVAVAASALLARQTEAQAVLERSGYEDRLERRERLMFTRLSRELRKIESGETVRLDVQSQDSLRSVELTDRETGKLTYSALGFAALVIGTALAIGLAISSRKGVEKVQVVNESKAFESRHTVWQRQLLSAASAATDGEIGKGLSDCSETVRYAGRDPSALGTPVNAQIDAVVQSLCRIPAPSEPELAELSGALRSLVVQRENAIREELARIANLPQ